MRSEKLVKNTFFLYILMFSTQILNLITIPYQTRILEPVVFGVINVCVAVMTYVQLVLDFGFMLSATADVTKNKNDISRLKYINSSVFYCKIVLSIIILGIFIIINSIFNITGDYLILYILYFVSYLIGSLIPDYIYRGMEDMKQVALRTLAIRIFFTIMIFVFVKNSDDYLIIPLLLLIGNIIAVGYSYMNIYKTYNIKFIKVKIVDIIDTMKNSFPYFISRFASSFYQVLNTIIIGSIYKGMSVVGFYTSSDKLINIAKSFSSPVADSLYPYMIRKKNYNLIKKILLIVMPLILLAGVIVFIYAEDLCGILFGVNYKEAGNILRCLLPIAIVIFPTYLLAFPIMVPMGLEKYAIRSNVIGAVIQIILFIGLFVTKSFNIYSIAVCASIVEVSVFIYRLSIVLIFRHKLNKEKLNYC